ncbi:TPA: BPSS1780 family membrane protein [Proteus mirabilis]|uniref:BPSS1780 family membrane protein n=1 Tax=Proteus mirabilis TaxID=584 RepID=UPI0038BFEF83
MEQDNSSSLTEPEEVFTPVPLQRGASGATEWLGIGWDLVKERFFMWVSVVIIYFLVNLIISSILGFIPLIGPIISPFISAVLVAGLMMIAHQQYETGQLNLDNLFSGFQNKRYLSIMGAYGISVLIILAGFILALLISGSLLMEVAQAALNDAPTYYIQGLLADNLTPITFSSIIIIIFSLISTASYWFAPALILVNDYKAIPAVKASFMAVKNNLFGGFLFFVLLSIIIGLSIIPFGLGLFITIPLSFTAMYGSYRHIFYQKNMGNMTNNYTDNNDNNGDGGNKVSLNKTAESNIGKLVS